jgi:Ca-activated chloride channel family protein
MRFLQPQAASWLLVIPLAVCAWYFYVHGKGHFRRRASIGPNLRAISRLSSWRRDMTVLMSSLVAVGALVMAMMRPQVVLETRVPEYEKEDLVLILDRSVSMRAEDVLPTRFGRAIAEIKTFLAQKPETIDRVALVGFAGTSLLLSPFTRDTGNLAFYLDWIAEDRDPHFGTNIGNALASARDLVLKDKKPTRKVFLIISDGDDQGPELARVLASLRDEQTHVYTIGIGSDRAVRIPTFTERGAPSFLRDDRGTMLQTRLNESTLRNIATMTGGRYIRSYTGTELAAAMHDAVQRERKIISWNRSRGFRDLYRECLATAGLATLVLLLAL